ncbi:carbamoyl phosphate synthase large subunit [Photobacterium rosenbergii]|uniref:Carbamoyl phosphate synthase large subunit n=1 Tax=Photobacterium rosenbergii TaxID=294936 RepID=A0A2T3NBM2_9GAMM|nr:ATP-grasp domain-containing protein [Photobacterium rosenbergii]PSW11201.1 carbamoyl phosphate synthase large subunit [Photobacterium rosenbergii]
MRSNVLVLSAGRRVELVEEFQNDLKALLPEGKVYCTDMYPKLSSACFVADGYFEVPRVTDATYISKILEICKQNNIGLVVPTIDTELELLSEERHQFDSLGVHVLISDPELIAQCRDKRKTARLFDNLRVDQPKILNRDKLSFPCFCKPYDGSCSKGALAIHTEQDLTSELLSDPKNMFMELVPKTYSEYTIDGYYTRDGVLKCLVPRKRLEVRGGEVSKGLTKKNFVYDYLLERVGQLPGARGCITFQLFVNETELAIKGLEINPRFGGGYPLAYAAGAKFPEYAIREFLLDEEVNFKSDWVADLLMLRYDAKVLRHDHTE